MSEVLVEPTEKLAARLPIWWISPGHSASSRAIATIKGLLPLARDRFERRLAVALEQAGAPNSFVLGDFAARRALGANLVIDVDPMRLTERMKHHSGASPGRIYLHDKFIGSGQWQSMLRPISASVTHRDVQEIIGAGLDYRNTRAYRQALKKAGEQHPIRRNFVALKTPQLVDRYFQQVVELCRSIGENGISRRVDFRHTATAFKNPTVRLPWVELTEADIGIAIGVDGELHHFGSGKHRIAAAQALRLRSVPVEVRVVHASWLRRQMGKGVQSPLSALLQGIQSLDQR